MYCWFLLGFIFADGFWFFLVVDVLSSVTIESSGLFSVKSELRLKVQEEDKDAKFYCEVTYFVPGATKMTETPFINVTVLCKFFKSLLCMWIPSGLLAS